MIKEFTERIYERDVEKEINSARLRKRLKLHKDERLKEMYETEFKEANELNNYFETLIDFDTNMLNYESLFISTMKLRNNQIYERNRCISSISNLKIVQHMLNFYIEVAQAHRAELKKKKVKYLLDKVYYEFKEWTKKRYGLNKTTNIYMRYLDFR